MEKESNEKQKDEKLRSSANQQHFRSQNIQSNWPPPLQLKEEKGDDGEELSTVQLKKDEIASPPPSNPEENKILDSNITVQRKPPQIFEQLGAKAFTQGSNIFLKNSFDADNSSDQNTFLHEVSHALENQSSAPKATTTKSGVPVNDDSNLESKADADAVQLSQQIGTEGIQNIISEKSSGQSISNQVVQRKETEDEKKIKKEQSTINKINREQESFIKSQQNSYLPIGFSSDHYDPNASFENKKSHRYSELIPLLKKDIIFVVEQNTRYSEKIAQASAKKHLSNSQEAIVDLAYSGHQHINNGRSQIKPESPNRGGRLGSLSMEPSEAGKQEIAKGTKMVNAAKKQDPLVFIAANMGRLDLLGKLTSGKSKQEKIDAVREILEIFNTYTVRAIEYVRKSPFEFQPAINQLLHGKKGSTGFNWSSDASLLNGVVGQAQWEETLSSLGPDILALVLAIAAGFASGGTSAALLIAGMGVEATTVTKSYEGMMGTDAASKSNADEGSMVLDKALAEGKQLEFFITAGGSFLGAASDGVEILGMGRNMLKKQYLKFADKGDNVKLTKISKEEYLSKFGDGDSEMDFVKRTNKHEELLDKKKKEGASKEELSQIKMSDADEKLNQELRLVLNKNKAEFQKRMPAAIRNAGGWKALIKKVGDDAFIRAGMEQWRSDLFREMDSIIANKYGKSLVRTGSQAKAQAGIVELMKGSKSDLDLSIPFNKVAEARQILRDHLCQKLSCDPNQLDDYLDMSIFANTPVKAVINTVKDSGVRNTLLEEQSRFEMVTIYNMLLKKAKSMGKNDTVEMLEKQMDRLKINKEDFTKYESLADQDQLQSVIDRYMTKVEALEIKITQNDKKINQLLKQDSPDQKELKSLRSQNQQFKSEARSAKMEAMKGTTFMDISESESFWSHAGIMEVVFKQNEDFSYLIDNAYSPAQKQVMVVHDMAQLETKLMKFEQKGVDFSGVQGIDNKLLKDTCKSSSRLANALSINAADEATKKKFAEISQRLINYKNQLSGPVSDEMVLKFKTELQQDLINIDQLCKKQIDQMADASITKRFANQNMIHKFEGDMKRAMLEQQTRNMLSRVLNTFGKKSIVATKTIRSNVMDHNDHPSKSSVHASQKLSSANSTIKSGNSLDAVSQLTELIANLQNEGQAMDGPKWDLINRNIARDFKYLKSKSNRQGGLFSKDDLQRADYVRRNLNKIEFHFQNSTLGTEDKAKVLEITSLLEANVDFLIQPKQEQTPQEKQKKVVKKQVKPELKLENSYHTVKDREKKEAELDTPILKTHNGNVPLSLRTKEGKYIRIMKGEQYYVNGRNQVLGKEVSK